jgi:catechol 2,3-dioxygenase-like lactoylglutathione lyase family enzyme
MDRGVGHVADLDRALSFYRHALGLPLESLNDTVELAIAR